MSAKRPAPPLPEPLTPLVDAHTHLDACGATDAASVAEMVDRAAAVGVGRVVTVADDLDAARWAVRAANWDDRVYAAVALHPTRANALDDAARTELEKLVADPRVVAVGETGLDYYWPGKLEGCADVETQIEGFRWHIDLAKRIGKPLMIHNREADHDLLTVLLDEGAPETVIFHCFSSDANMAVSCVAEGYVLSFSGTASFKNAHELREAVRVVPDEQLLFETDAPYLTPHPYRGAPNEPYCLPYTVRAVAEIRGQDPDELAEISTANARRIYRFGRS
ncbi:TatD family hydrolase [Nocardia rhamnosiphila]